MHYLVWAPDGYRPPKHTITHYVWYFGYEPTYSERLEHMARGERVTVNWRVETRAWRS